MANDHYLSLYNFIKADSFYQDDFDYRSAQLLEGFKIELIDSNLRINKLNVQLSSIETAFIKAFAEIEKRYRAELGRLDIHYIIEKDEEDIDNDLTLDEIYNVFRAANFDGYHFGTTDDVKILQENEIRRKFQSTIDRIYFFRLKIKSVVVSMIGLAQPKEPESKEGQFHLHELMLLLYELDVQKLLMEKGLTNTDIAKIYQKLSGFDAEYIRQRFSKLHKGSDFETKKANVRRFLESLTYNDS